MRARTTKVRRRHRIAAGTSYDFFVYGPKFLPGIVAWYDFNDITTLFQDTALTTPVTTDGQSILGVTDKSGNGYTLTEATNGPLYKTNISGGRAAALFNGTSSKLTNAAFPDFGDACTWCFVGAHANVAPVNRWVFEVSNGTAATGFSHLISITTGLLRSRAVDATAARDATKAALDASDGVWRIAIGRLDDTKATEQHLWVDGDTPAAGASYDGPNPNTLSQLNVGCSAAGANFFSGYMGELIIYSQALVLTQVNSLGTYAATWGPTWTTGTE